MKILHKCDLCGSEELEHLCKLEDYNRGFEGTFNLYMCKSCGLMFLNPQPSFEELEKYYPSDYYRKIEERPSTISKINVKFMRKLYALSVKHSFIFKTFLFPLSPFVRGVNIIPNTKYLDVGCGGGQFLFETKILNSTAEYYGVEPGNFDKEDVKKHGLNVFKGTLEEAHYPDDYFDVVTMNHVFEHVHNPSETMKELRRVLKPGGTLILAVPNYRSLAFKLSGKYWYQLDAPRHLFTYSDEILKKYAKKFNLKVEKIRYGAFWDQTTFIVSGMHYFNMFIPKKNLWKYLLERVQKGYIFPLLIFGSLFVLLFPFITLLNILKFGDSVEIWFKK